MAQGYTLDQLQKMGAKPAPTSGGLTLDQLQAMQAQPSQQTPAHSDQPLATRFANGAASVMDNTVGGGLWAKTLGILGAGNTKTGKAAQSATDSLQQNQQQLIAALQNHPQGDPRRAQIAQQIQNNSKILGGTADQTLADLPTAKKFVSSGAQLGLTALGAAAPAGQTLRARTLVSGLQGAAQGAAQAYGNSSTPGLGISGQDAKSMALGGALTGAASAGITGGLGLLGRLFKGATTNAPEAMANSVIGDSSKATGQKIARGAPTLGQQILQDPNLKTSDFFSAPRLQAAMQGQVNLNEDQLQAVLNSPEFAGKNISKDELLQYLQPLIAQGQNTPGQGGAAALAQAVGDEVKPTYSLPEANVMKRNLYQAAKTQFGTPDAVTRAGAQKQLGLGAKDLIEKATMPNPVNPALLEGQFTPQMAKTFADEASAGGARGITTPGDASQIASDFRRMVGGAAAGVSPVTPINQKLGMYSQALSNILPKVGKEANSSPFMPSDALILGAGTAEGKPALGGAVDAVKHFFASPSGRLATSKLLSNTGKPFNAIAGSSNFQGLQALRSLLTSRMLGQQLNKPKQ